MPHIRLEHTIEVSTNLASNLFKKIVHILTTSTTIQSTNCKSRAIKINNFHMGSNNHNNFIHLEIILLEGRSNEIKQKIGKEIIILLKDSFQQSSKNDDLQISVEIREMNKKHYFTTNSI